MSGLGRFLIPLFMLTWDSAQHPLSASATSHDSLEDLLERTSKLVLRPQSPSSADTPTFQEKAKRKDNLWSPLAKTYDQQGIRIPEHVKSSQLPKILCFSTDDDRSLTIYRDRSAYNQSIYYDPIYYHVYCLSDVYTKRTSPKGVIFHVYGGAKYIEKQEPEHTSNEIMLARDGYIVYSINTKGVETKGEWFRTLQGRAGGLFTTIDDINYFAYLLRYGLKDSSNRSPYLSSHIEENIPFILLGSSMGGHVTLLIATSSHNSLYVPYFRKKIQTDNLFDGYISLMPIVDVHGDVVSSSSGGQSRLTYFTSTQWQEKKFSEWMKNAYTVYNPFLSEMDNQLFSPLYRADKLHAPTFLFHGLRDTNVSPEQTIAFYEACRRYGTDKWLTVCYDPEGQHKYPSEFIDTYNFYESVYQFLDHVIEAKHQGELYTLSDDEQDLAYSSTRLAHYLINAQTDLYKNLATSFAYAAAESYFTYSVTTTDPKAAWRNYAVGHPIEFYKALIECHVHEALSTLNKRGRELLEIKKQRVNHVNAAIQALLEIHRKPTKTQLKAELKFILDHPASTPLKPPLTTTTISGQAYSWTEIVKTTFPTQILSEYKKIAPLFYALFQWFNKSDAYKGYQRFIRLNKNIFKQFQEIIRIKKDATN
ncbi:MAG: alpha/beta hydrolase family protein [Candidatus Nucleicultricaceae bacterium]